MVEFQTPVVSRTLIGLGSVDNTTDIEKPVSLPQREAINAGDRDARSLIANLGVPRLVGSFDASFGSFPASVMIDDASRPIMAGDQFRVAVAGVVDGVSFSKNDTLTAIIDAASLSVYVGQWIKGDNSEILLSATVQPADTIADMLALSFVTVGQRVSVPGQGEWAILAAGTYAPDKVDGKIIRNMNAIAGQAVSTSRDAAGLATADPRTIALLRSVYGPSGTIIMTYDGYAVEVDLAQAASFDDTTAGGVQFKYRQVGGCYQGEAFGIDKYGALSTSQWQKALTVAAGKKLVFGAGVFAFSLLTGTMAAAANTHIQGAGAGTIFDVVGDSQGLDLSARHITFSDFRLRGSASMASDKACLILGEGGDTARSRLRNIVVGGRGGTPAPLEAAVVLTGDAIRGNHVFLTNFDSIYAYNARYGMDICKANGGAQGLQNANAYTGCEFHNCTWGYRAGRLKGCTFDACTFEGNAQHGLILGFVNGTCFDGIYFESNHKTKDAAIRADMLVDPAMVGEVDPGGGLKVSGWFTKGANSDYGIYVVKQRGFELSAINVNAGYLVKGIYVEDNVSNTGVIGPANFVPDGITNLSPQSVAMISGGRMYNYDGVSASSVVSGGTFDLFTPVNDDIWDVWITRNSTSTTIYWFGTIMRAASGALLIVSNGSSNITVSDASGVIRATNGTGSTQSYLWAATKRANL